MKQWPNTRKRSHWMKIAASLLGRLYAKIGRRDEALAVLERLRQNSEERYVSPYNFLLSMSDLAERTKRSIFSNKPTRMGTDTTSRSSKSIRSSIPCAGIPRFEALVQKGFAAR